jgi:hypothetical protein
MIFIQSKLGKIYSGGCYFLSLLHQTNTPDSKILEMYDYFVKKGFMDEECFIKDPVSIMKYLTGNNYTVEKTTSLPAVYDFAVYYWYNPTTRLHHFTLKDWDSLGNSNTRINGRIESYRIYRKKI